MTPLKYDKKILFSLAESKVCLTHTFVTHSYLCWDNMSIFRYIVNVPTQYPCRYVSIKYLYIVFTQYRNVPFLQGLAKLKQHAVKCAPIANTKDKNTSNQCLNVVHYPRFAYVYANHFAVAVLSTIDIIACNSYR